jgi:pantetheine-phosphate adenylyltransferase
MKADKNVRRVVYAGSFDPVTNGHLWMIHEAVKMFDEVVVAVGVNPDKKGRFSTEERKKMLRQAVGQTKKVTVTDFTGRYLVDYAKVVRAKFVLRGIRNSEDYEFERMMRHVNEDINPKVTSVFLMPPRSMSEISSSVVRGMVGFRGWKKRVAKYVPKVVLKELEKLVK